MNIFDRAKKNPGWRYEVAFISSLQIWLVSISAVLDDVPFRTFQAIPIETVDQAVVPKIVINEAFDRAEKHLQKKIDQYRKENPE